jgi:phospholipid/cholesterol/gamma-HCH transport system substrate-binding protein
MDTINNTGQALKEAADALKVAANKVNGILDTEQTHIHEVLGNAADALKAIRTILGDQETQAKLAEAMQKLPKSLDSMNQTFETANRSIQAFTEPGEDGRSAVERMINAISITENTMKRFSEGEDAPAEQLRQAIAHVNEITSFTAAITKSIQDGNGSLGALIKDRELYDRLNHAARNISEVTEKLKPIVDDARVISDKVARHPGVILRDAVKPGPGIK